MAVQQQAGGYRPVGCAGWRWSSWPRPLGWQLERLTFGEHRPGHARVLGRNGHHRLPITTPLLKGHRPAAQAVVLGLGRVEHGPRAHHQQAAQVGVARFGDAPEPGFSSRAGLPWHQSDPGRELAPAAELSGIAHHRNNRGGRDLAHAHQLHQLLRGIAVPRHGADVHVALLDALAQVSHLAEQVTDAQVGKAGQVLQPVARFAPNHFGLERQQGAELTQQAADAVDAGGALGSTPWTAKMFFAKSIPVAIMTMGLPLPSALMSVRTVRLGIARQRSASRITGGGDGPYIR